jgi:hypothetical protein
MEASYAIGFGLTLVTFLIFFWLMFDCFRRSEKDFPTLIYGGKEISQRSIKRTWEWILIFTIILGIAVRPTIYAYSATIDKTSLASSITAEHKSWTLF